MASDRANHHAATGVVPRRAVCRGVGRGFNRSMQDKLDIRTSASLLEKLRIFQEQQAWERFMSLYTPLLAAWGRRAGLPEHEVEELIGQAGSSSWSRKSPRSCTTRQRGSGAG